LATVGVYIFVVFGFLSRRCERQADVYACRAVSCSNNDCIDHELSTRTPQGQGLCPTGIRTFIQALEKVAILNGISRERPGWLQSWQHSTIARRVDFLQRLIQDRQVNARFQRAITAWKWCSLIVLGAVLLLLGQEWGWSTVFSF
jgi:STE24 endopeptidase